MTFKSFFFFSCCWTVALLFLCTFAFIHGLLFWFRRSHHFYTITDKRIHWTLFLTMNKKNDMTCLRSHVKIHRVCTSTINAIVHAYELIVFDQKKNKIYETRKMPNFFLVLLLVVCQLLQFSLHDLGGKWKKNKHNTILLPKTTHKTHSIVYIVTDLLNERMRWVEGHTHKIVLISAHLLYLVRPISKANI